MSLDIHLSQKLLGLTKKKALMIKFNIIINNKVWLKYLKNPSRFIESKTKLLNKKFKKHKKKKIFISLLLSGDNEIKKLNQRFRKKNTATDVLSFPFHSKNKLKSLLKNEKEIYLGDIIINVNRIKNKDNIISFKKELNELWVHGLLHLFGFDHKRNEDYIRMFNVEKKFLNYIND